MSDIKLYFGIISSRLQSTFKINIKNAFQHAFPY